MGVPSDYSQYLHVVAAAIVDHRGHVLIARRPEHLDQGGLWEFPGGKVEPGESTGRALERELVEELGIVPTSCRPLIRIPYSYPHKNVFLDVWYVDRYKGHPYGREGQVTRWVTMADIHSYSFPPPNRPIVTALALPDRYLITPEPGVRHEWPLFLTRLDACLRAGVRLVQFRAKSLAMSDVRELGNSVVALCRSHGATVLINSQVEMAEELKADGVHMSSNALLACHGRPLGADSLVAASCHNRSEVSHAASIGVDFLVLSPVCTTQSHPEAEILGWGGFSPLAIYSGLPCYALGGLAPADIAVARMHGAQGIAAISGLWEHCGDNT